jgi:molecular chaperone GrpE
VFERHGVRRLNPRGEAFNPHLHQAMMEMENAEVAPGTVLEVYQAGYVIEDRVLRPAMVVVSKGGAKPARPAADEPTTAAEEPAAGSSGPESNS